MECLKQKSNAIDKSLDFNCPFNGNNGQQKDSYFPMKIDISRCQPLREHETVIKLPNIAVNDMWAA